MTIRADAPVRAVLLTAVLLGSGFVPGRAQQAPLSPPPLDREFRGVWVATVGNVDWPSEPGLSTWRQQQELRAILDRAAELNLNGVVFQVRPAGDALYESELEPWSEYLTGRMGQDPDPFWDPLAWAVREAHDRGLELHAWFNPFRARRAPDRTGIAASHLARLRPGLVLEYGEQLWMDPGQQAVRQHSRRVIMDVVLRYDIDGIHLDDYFYPYPLELAPGDTLPFPDDESWDAYRSSGGSLDRGHWRRANIDAFVEEIYDAVKAAKPWVKVGISPFGTWRPGYPPAIGGYDAYGNLYADARKWLWNGWLDYASPQLYWPIARTDLSFPILLGWWEQQNLHGRHLWPGLIPSRIGGDREGWSATEILRQIYVTRGAHRASGNIHFSMRALMVDSVAEALVTRAYTAPALVPASTWLDATPPAPPTISVGKHGDGLAVRFAPGSEERVWLWAVQVHATDGSWTTAILPGPSASHPIPETNDARADAVFVTAVDRYGNTSRPARAELP